MVCELSQLFIKYLEDTLNDVADIVRPLREDGELKEGPMERGKRDYNARLRSLTTIMYSILVGKGCQQ